jgi:hypothetical protein
MDYVKLYDLENYLFEVLHPRFVREKQLSAFDFFCIVVWKANRAKSRVANLLLAKGEQGREDLDAIVKSLTASLACAESEEARMRILIEDWRFRLPIASAILTVLWPENFTVYDVRVCDQLGNHHCVQNKTAFVAIWRGYRAYLDDVKKQEPTFPALRDKDRTLWAKSFEKQLTDDIATCFRKSNESS